MKEIDLNLLLIDSYFECEILPRLSFLITYKDINDLNKLYGFAISYDKAYPFYLNLFLMSYKKYKESLNESITYCESKLHE